MKSILAVALLIATLSLCNLTDKVKPEATSSPTPANSASDRATVLAELMKLEEKLTTASFNGDISTLAPNIADDYSGTSFDGKVQTKNQVLAATKPEKNVKSWKITDAQLVSFDGNSAVLSYVQTLTARNGRTASARITDTFVKRDGRWLVMNSRPS